MMIQIRRSFKYSVEATIGVMLLLVIGTVLTGCADKKTEEEFKVALLLPASKSDAGWNALAYKGLLQIKEQLGAKIMDVESRTPPEQEQHFRFYASKGYDLIIGHGYEYQDPAKAVASDFPDTIFFTSSGGTITDNISPANFRVEQPAYLLGIIAGMMTQGNKLGCIGGQEIPSVKSTFMAFEGACMIAWVITCELSIFLFFLVCLVETALSESTLLVLPSLCLSETALGLAS